MMLNRARIGLVDGQGRPLACVHRRMSGNHRWIIAALSAGIMSLPIQTAQGQNIPQFDHVVVVIMENHAFHQIVRPNRPFIYRLATNGALFVNAFAVSHPSQPNYFALFSGSTQGVRDNKDHTFDVPTLASALEAAGKSFIGYVETGSPRWHNPWKSFTNMIGDCGASSRSDQGEDGQDDSHLLLLRGLRQDWTAGSWDAIGSVSRHVAPAVMSSSAQRQAAGKHRTHPPGIEGSGVLRSRPCMNGGRRGR